MDHSSLSYSAPFYFGVAVWGRCFCESFVNYALASLLASGNIPSLPNSHGKNRFFIYTTSEDKAWLNAQFHIKELARYIQVEFWEMIPLSEEEYATLNNPLRSSKLYTMTLGHRDFVVRMHADKAIGSIVLPDSIYANNSLSSALAYISQGKTAVLVFCPRFATTELLNALVKENYIGKDRPLNIEPRALIKLAIKHLHQDIEMQRWDEPQLPEFMFEPHWMLPNQSGMIFHTWCAWYAFIHYGRLAVHHIESLGNNTIDGVYLGANLKKEETHLITDSDEFTLISFSPDIKRNIKPFWVPRWLPARKILNWVKVAFARIKIKVTRTQTEELKLHFAAQAIFMHTEDLTPECYALQKKAQLIVNKILRGKSEFADKITLFLCELLQLTYSLPKKFLTKLRRHGFIWCMRRIGRELMQPPAGSGKYFQLLHRCFYWLINKPLNFLFFLTTATKNTDTLYFFYDFEVEPITYDFAWALCLANARRQELNLKHLSIIFVPGTHHGLRLEASNYEEVVDLAARNWRIHAILLPVVKLLPAVSSMIFCASRKEALLIRERQVRFVYPQNYNVTFPTAYAAEQIMDYAHKLCVLEADKQALTYVGKWLATEAKEKKVIVITLRQYDYIPERNSNIRAWLKFAEALNAEEFFVVFIPDVEQALTENIRSLQGFNVFQPACWNLDLRCALYELAYLNLGVNTGPMSLCWLSERSRYLTFKIHLEDVPLATAKVLIERGFVPGKNPKFASLFQKWVWELDDYEVIWREFWEMCRALEINNALHLAKVS